MCTTKMPMDRIRLPPASFDDFARRMGGLAGEEYVCFGLKMFEKYCFAKVHTYTEREFQGYLKALQ